MGRLHFNYSTGGRIKGHMEMTIEHFKTPIERRTRVTRENAAYAGKALPNFISHNDLEYNANYNTKIYIFIMINCVL